MWRRFSSEPARKGEEPKEEPVLTQAVPAEQPAPASVRVSDAFLNMKIDLHRHLIERFNLSVLDRANKTEIGNEILPIVRDFVRTSNFPLNAREIDALVEDTADEMLGLGPIEPLLKDDSIADILINTHRKVYVERYGQIEETAVRFHDEAHLMRIVNKIVAAIGRRVDESSPMVDARLEDGSRVNVAIRPISIDGPLVSIRKFSRTP
jgi:pilus assembly protein CpaF